MTLCSDPCAACAYQYTAITQASSAVLLVQESSHTTLLRCAQERGITMKSSSISLVHMPSAEDRAAAHGAHAASAPTAASQPASGTGPASASVTDHTAQQQGNGKSGANGASAAPSTAGHDRQRNAHAPGAIPAAASAAGGAGRVSAVQMVDQGYLINLIDSPGHVDFCSEVCSPAFTLVACHVGSEIRVGGACSFS